MKYKRNISPLLFLICFFLFPFFGSGQAAKVFIDKSDILIGQQIHYKIKLNLASSGYAVDFGVPDSIPHFEILQKQQFDTVEKNGQYSLYQSMVLTSFDSGRWVIPAFIVTIGSTNKKSIRFSTDSIIVNVGYSPMDSSGLRDIKPVLEVKVPDYTWAYILAGILTLLFFGWLIYRYFKNRKKKDKPAFIPSLKPYDEAMQALKKLQAMDISTAEGIRIYHTKLSEIFKLYYSNKERKNMLHFTTTDMLINMKSNSFSAETISLIAEVLRRADVVKFAKYLPPVYENENSLQQEKAVIDTMEKNYSSKT
ncbi:MAG: hypothetical protein ABIY51_13085 [Ferruginibacter sp.]